MIFVVSKMLLGRRWQPGNLLMLLLALGVLLLLFGRRRAGAALVAGIAGHRSSRSWCCRSGAGRSRRSRTRFPQPHAAAADRRHHRARRRGQIPHDHAAMARSRSTSMAERITERWCWRGAIPTRSCCCRGGNGALLPRGLTEAEATRQLLVADGLDPSRLLLEDRSRNTYENAVDSKALADPQPGQIWLLVTSADAHAARRRLLPQGRLGRASPIPVDLSAAPSRLLRRRFRQSALRAARSRRARMDRARRPIACSAASTRCSPALADLVEQRAIERDASRRRSPRRKIRARRCARLAAPKRRRGARRRRRAAPAPRPARPHRPAAPASRCRRRARCARAGHVGGDDRRAIAAASSRSWAGLRRRARPAPRYARRPDRRGCPRLAEPGDARKRAPSARASPRRSRSDCRDRARRRARGADRRRARCSVCCASTSVATPLIAIMRPA